MDHRRFVTHMAACTAAAALICAAQAGDVLYVDDDGPVGGDGASWATCFRFLQDALQIASDPANGVTEIHVAQGTYRPDRDEANPDGTGDREASFQLIDNLALLGGYAGIAAPDPDEHSSELHETVLCGDIGDPVIPFDNSYHVVTGSGCDETALLDGFTITAGMANGLAPDFPSQRGAGLYNDGGGPTVANCTFSGNTARRGGGMYNDQSSPTVAHCNFIGNSAIAFTSCCGMAGGGGMASVNSSPLVVNCTFEGNWGRLGGGMLNEHGDLAMIQCTFLDNTADIDLAGIGGGMCNTDTDGGVINCTFSGNWAHSGGAMMNRVGSRLVVIDCVFNSNAVTWSGGGMVNTSLSAPPAPSDTVVINCTFTGNTAERYAGGMYNELSDPTVVDCTFSENEGLWGGGMQNGSSDATIANCTFIANVATLSVGGGMSNYDCSPTVANCTFSGNWAVENGGGMNNGSNASPTVTNCILWGNVPNGIGGAAAVTYSDVQGTYPGTGNIDADPLFVDPGNGDFRLSLGSPCIDAGDNAAVPEDITTDLDGNPRFVDDPNTEDTGYGDPPLVDMGAFEYQALCPWDLDGDGTVTVVDLLLVIASFGPCEGCPADIDGDGFVNVVDLLALIANFGPCPGSLCVWDVNGDGVVDQADVQQVLENVGPCDGCAEDVNGDGIVNGQDAAAVATHFGPCP
jgi:hypothetical protein